MISTTGQWFPLKIMGSTKGIVSTKKSTFHWYEQLLVKQMASTEKNGFH